MNYFRYKEDFLGDHREVTRILGMGSFGHVVCCYNWETGQMEAVKRINQCPRAIEYAEQEIKILERLKVFNPDGCGIVRFYESFLHRGVICLSFEVLDQDLKAYIQDFQVQSGLFGLPLVEVRAITCQMLVALDVLACNGVIHCDIKPENIMVVDRDRQPVTVKLVDFGAAQNSFSICPENLVQSLWYSSPEVMLDCPYNEAIDLWALGVTAAELVLGNPLYPEMNTYNMLRSIIKTQGVLPEMLHLDPQQCVTAEDALKHPFFAYGFKTPAALQNMGTENIGTIKLENTESQAEIYDIPADIYLQSPLRSPLVWGSLCKKQQ